MCDYMVLFNINSLFFYVTMVEEINLSFKVQLRTQETKAKPLSEEDSVVSYGCGALTWLAEAPVAVAESAPGERKRGGLSTGEFLRR